MFFLSNADMDNSENVTGSGTLADPYIVTLPDCGLLVIKNLTTGSDNVIIQNSNLYKLDVECGCLRIEGTTLSSYAKVNANNVSLINNPFYSNPSYLFDFQINSISIEIENNTMASHRIFIFSSDEPIYLVVRSNIIHSLILYPTHIPKILEYNHFIAQQPLGDTCCPIEEGVSNNYFENYADFYPEATHDGLFWSIPFGRYGNATCKSPLLNTPAVPFLSYRTNLEKVDEDVANVYKGYQSYPWSYFELQFYSPETAYYKIYTEGWTTYTTTDSYYRFYSPDAREYTFRVQAINMTGSSGLSNTIKIIIVKVFEPIPNNTSIIMNLIFALGGAVCAICITVIAKLIKGRNKNKKVNAEFQPEMTFE